MRRVPIVFLVAGLLAISSVGVFAFPRGHEKEKKKPVKIEDLYKAGKYQKAIDLAKKFEAKGEVSEGLYLDMGAAQFKLKRYEDAIASFKKAEEQNMFGTKAILFEATCYHDLKQPDKVIECYQRALDIDPSLDAVHYNLGRLYESEKNPEPAKALAQYQAIYNDNPTYKDVTYAIGLIHFNAREYDKAQPYLEKALSKKPDDAHILLALGQNELKNGKYGKAVKTLERFVNAKGADPVWKPAVLDQIAVSNEKLKDYAAALHAYEEILSLRPNNSKALLGKGNALIQLKRYKEAIPALERYLEISRNRVKKKQVKKVLGDLKKAVKRH